MLLFQQSMLLSEMWKILYLKENIRLCWRKRERERDSFSPWLSQVHTSICLVSFGMGCFLSCIWLSDWHTDVSFAIVTINNTSLLKLNSLHHFLEWWNTSLNFSRMMKHKLEFNSSCSPLSLSFKINWHFSNPLLH